MKLLVIDSDRDLVEMLTSWLKMLSYEVARVYTAERAGAIWMEYRPDLVLLDTANQDVDMLAFCRELCLRHDALLLVMTESQSAQDEVRCLNAGADDYLRKPFFPSQLLARIRALSRRSRATLERRPSSVVTVGSLCVDLLHNQVTIDERTVRLTPTESKLLHFLAINANDVCTADQIVTHVWGYGGDGDTSLIKAHIRHLRQKIEADPAHPRSIVTVSGVGYSLVACKVSEPDTGKISPPLRVVSR